MNFEWDSIKDTINHDKHGVSFAEAQRAFLDPNRVITIDRKHSTERETRFFCFGNVDGRIMTVRFTYRQEKIRLFGAGYWREGRKRYEEQQRLRGCTGRDR